MAKREKDIYKLRRGWIRRTAAVMQYKGVLISGVTATVQSDVKLCPGSTTSEAALKVHEVDPNGIPDTWWCSTAVWIRSRANAIP